jgi:hypothetical protein
MAILDNELLDGGRDVSKEQSSLPEQPLGSPNTRPLNLYLGGFDNFTTKGDSKTGLTIDQLSSFSKMPSSAPTFASPMQMVPGSELDENKRYDLYLRDRNLENIYGLQQSALSQWGNAAVKFAATAVGTFAMQFSTIPDAISAIKKGSVSELSGKDGYKSDTDMFLRNMEDAFPNYMTDYEKEHPYLAMVPFATGSANFWGNMVLKNLGFTAGAIGGAFVQDLAVGAITGGIGEIPLLASQIGRASLYLNKVFAGTNKVDKVLDLARALNKSEQTILNIKNLAYAAESAKIINGARFGLAMYGSTATESAVESRDGYRQIKEELTRQYKLEHFNSDPTGKDAEQIEDLATNGMNARFGINMGLLLLSNNIQFGNLFKSMIAKDGKLLSGVFSEGVGEIGLKKGSIDVFESKVSEKLLDKAWEKVKPVIGNALAEGVYEEGGQFAAERGTYDYYTRRYKNLSIPRNNENWNTLNEAIKSTGFGLSEQFGKQEGVENMIVGAISAIVSGGILGRIDSRKNNSKDKRTQSAINILNNSPITGSFGQKYDSTLNSMGIASEMKDAVSKGDVYKFNNLKEDMFFNFVTSRIPSGMHDVTIEQLKMLKGLDKEEFEKTFGMNFSAENKGTVSEYVDAMIEKAEKIKEITDSVNLLFKNPFNYYANPTNEQEEIERENYKIFEQYKTDIAYYHNVKDISEDKLQKHDAHLKMNINPMLSAELVSNILRKDGAETLRDEYELEAAALGATITEFTSPQDKKQIRDRIKALRTMSEKINLAIAAKNLDSKGLGKIINFEIGGRKSISDNIISGDSFNDMYNIGIDVNRDRIRRDKAANAIEALSDKKGFKEYFIQAEQVASQSIPEEQEAPVVASVEITNKEGKKEPISVGREYQIEALSPAKINKIADDRYELITPYGDSLFFSNKDTAQEAAEEFNDSLQDYNKVKVLDINADGTLKIEDNAGNITNVDPRKLSGYELVESVEEKMGRHKSSLDQQLSTIFGNSGDIPTSFETGGYEEPALKDAPIFYISTVTESEGGEKNGWEAPISSSPHVIRARYFLNNAKFYPNRGRMKMIVINHKNIEALKLNGIVQMSYNVDASTKVEDIEYDGNKATNVEYGWMASVFVEQDATDGSLHYVDQNGERIGKVGVDTPSLGKIIFQTMPTIKTTDSKGQPRYRGEQQVTLEAYSKAWKKYREDFWQADPNKYEAFEFKISRGIPSRPLVPKLDENGNPVLDKDGKQVMESDKNYVSDVLIPSDLISKTKGIIQISSTGTISHQGESINVPKGRPFFQYGDTLTFIRSSKFSKQQAANLYEIINAMANELIAAQAAGKTPEINTRYSDYLSNVLFWSNRTSPSTNQINLNTDTMQLEIGGIKYGLSEIADKRDEIVNKFQNTYFSINKKTLDGKFFDKFYELYTTKDADGKVVIEERQWTNYQSFLLSNKYPDGKSRSVNELPLFTDIAEPSDGKLSFKQKYAVINGINLPVQTVPKEAPKQTPPPGSKEEPMVGNFFVNKKENIIELKPPFGKVRFKAVPGEKGFFNVEAVSEGAKDLIERKNKGEQLAIDTFNSLKEILVEEYKDKNPEFVSRLSDEQIINALAQIIISSKLKTLNEQPAAPVAPTPTAPVVSAAIADIERRRQELLKEAKVINDRNIELLKDNGTPEPYVVLFDVKEGETSNTFSNKVSQINAITYEELIDKINAKYDAELAALEGAKPSYTYKGIQVIDSSSITTATGEPGAAQYNRTENKITINRELLKKKFDEKAWTSPRKQKDGSSATALSADAFSTYDAWEKFVIEHEFQHSLLSYEESGAKTVGEYEDIINQRALGVEGKPEDKKPPITPPGGNFSAPPTDDDYREISELDEDNRITEEDLAIFKNYVAEVAPNIPYEILENVIKINRTRKAWGVFEKGIVKFVRGGLKGTEYHELGEAIWNGMLSNEEQDAIIADERAKGGTFIDRLSGKKLQYATATRQQIKERIMDDFADYRVGKLPARSLSERIRRFFKAIVDFFKSFGTKPSLKEQLFKDIDAGKFKKEFLFPSVYNKAAEYRAVEGLTEVQTRDFVEDMTARVAVYLFGKSKRLIFNPEKITGVEIFTNIKKKYYESVKPEDRLSEESLNTLIQKTKEKLTTLGITITDDAVDINTEEYNSKEYGGNPFKIDWKQTSPAAIRFVLATLIRSKNEPIEQIIGKGGKLSPELSSVNGYRLINFSKAFGQILEKLSNTTSVQEAVNKTFELAKDDVNYISLLKRLGADISTLSGDKIATMKFDQFDENDWRLFINFWQTFTKQKPDALIEYISGTNVYTQSANFQSAKKEVERAWIENMKLMASDPSSIIKYSAANDKSGKQIGSYIVNTSVLNSLPIRNVQQQIDYLSAIGINFPIDIWQKLSDVPKKMNDKSEKQKFDDAVSSLKSYFGANREVYSVKSKTLQVSGPVSILSELYAKASSYETSNTYIGVDGTQVGSYSENNAPSLFENQFNESNSIDELKQQRPELNDVFSKNSLVLKSGGMFYNEEGRSVRELKVGYIQGGRDRDAGKGLSGYKMSRGYRYAQEINQNLNGRYFVLNQGDGSTPWLMTLGNNISFDDVSAGRAWSQVYDVFTGYLEDEIALASDWKNRKHLANIGEKKAKQLRWFREILPAKTINEIESKIDKGDSVETIMTYVKENAPTINEAVKTYIDRNTEKLKNILVESGQIITREKDLYSYPMLDSDFATSRKFDKSRMTEKGIDNILSFVTINYTIANTEFHKILFGDPYQFKISDKNGEIILDELKRIKSFLSPARSIFNSDEYNNFLNNKYNNVGDVALTEDTPGYHLHKSHTDTITIKDDVIASRLANLLPSAYGEVNVADAASWLMDNTYKEIKLKSGQWDDAAEAFHQWQMAYTRSKFAEKGIYTYPENGKLKAIDKKTLSKPSPEHKLNILKPIVRGSKDGMNHIELVLDKFSQMPIYFSLVEGTQLEDFYIKMFNSKKGYGIVESGRKLGTDETYSLYNGNGEFNTDGFNNNVRVPWSAYSVQVETSYQADKQQIRGTQPTKLVSIDLFENGIPVSDKALRAYRRNKEILDMMHENAYNELLNKLGIEDLGDGFVLSDGNAISEALAYEMFRRELSDNIKDSIQVDDNGEFIFPLEASPSYGQIKNIVYSFIHKSIISVKVNGRPHVQAPVTGFAPLGSSRQLVRQIKDEQGNKKFVNISKEEYEALDDKSKKSVALTDNTLKFYTKDAPYCEVMLPHWFKVKMGGKFKNEAALLDYLNNSPEGKKILSGVAFRIPTQSLSSMEVFRVKGFLPSYMGDTIIVPAEITTKAGSDFDIDKLNMYLKATYIDRNGNIKLVKYLGSEAETKEFFSKEFDSILKNKIFKKNELREAADILSYGLDDPKELVDKYGEILDIMLEGMDPADFNEMITSELKKLTDAQAQAVIKNKWVKEMYKRSIENEYFESMEELLTLPEAFERLITPVDDAGLKKVSQRIIELRGETKSELSILDRTYMTEMRHLYEMAKNWIGIVAVNITGVSITQKVPTYIDPRRFSLLKPIERNLLGNGVVYLPHNSYEKNNEKFISLSGRKTADGTDMFISKRLSGYASGTVDVVKDPYLSKVIRSQLLVGPAMFLERIGAGQSGINFLNQPIIVEYVKMLDNKNIRSLFNSRNIQAIRDRFSYTPDSELVDVPFNVSTLEENIEAYYKNGKLSNSQLIEQQRILTEFLKYAKMAEQNFKFTQAINYDTTKFRSGEALTRKQFLTEKARTQNIICCVDNILEETFIGKQAYLLNSFRQAMGTVFKTEQDIYRFITENTLMKAYAEDEYLSNDDFEKIANKIKASFIDYLILTKTSIGSEVERLMVDPKTSVASRLGELAVKYPEVDVLKRLIPISSDRMLGGKNVKLIINDRGGEAENMNTGMMRELRDSNNELKEFYNDLVKLSILQGTYFSQSSIRNVIPVEDLQTLISPVIRGLNSTNGLEAFIQGSFHRNAFKDDDVVPKVMPKFFFASEDPATYQVDMYGEFYADIFQYYSSLFPNIEMLGMKSTSRMILELNEKYNSGDVPYMYVKVPRVVTDRTTGEMIDMKTGLTITKLSFAEMKQKGDPSLNDVYGYKKVMVNDEPLTYKNDKGDTIYVYKLVNLYGDNPYTVEHKEVFTKSVIDNGTVKVETEIPDSSIVEYYLGKQPPLLQPPKESTQPSTGEKANSERKTYKGRVVSLAPNEIFVFGSNIGSSKGGAPTHGAGSAKLAREKFGAIQGQPRGLQGKSYGIVTKKYYDVEKSSTPQEIINEIKGLYEYAKQNPDKKFLVSDYSEKNLNGYTGQEMANMFSSAGTIPSNIVFNENFDKLVEVSTKPTEQAPSKVVEDIVTAPGYVKESAKKHLPKELFKIRQATQFIGTGGGNDSTTQRMENAYTQVGLANTGNYTSDDLIYVSSNGNRGNRFINVKDGVLQGPYKLIDKAIATGARFIMDTKAHLDNTSGYNIGEVDMANYLTSKGYIREDASGIWSASIAPTVDMNSRQTVAGNEKPTIFETRKNPLSYTTGQTKALLDIQKLIDDSTQSFYLLAGYAGTGKTTLVENMVNYSNMSGRPVLIMAPTNKAVVVLNEKLKESDAKANTSTIHRSIYGEPDPQTGEWIPKALLENSLIIIDESSMISKELMSDLINAAKGRNNIVIFLGDGFQLEQIGEDSGLFSSLKGSSKFQENYGTKLIGSTELTEVKRQSLDSNVLKMATLTREDKKAYIPSVSMEDFTLSSGKGEFISSFRKAIADGEDVIGIVATNNERMIMNQVARMAKFGDGEKAILIDSEKVMSVANSENFANGETFTVDSIGSERADLSTTISITDKNGTVKNYPMKAYEVKTKEIGRTEILFFFSTLDRPSMYHAEILKSIRETNPSLYDGLQSSGLAIRTIKGVKLSPSVIIGTYGYAVTGHKSQGSQWEKVFVNQNYVAPEWNSARWYYTAITRSSKEVILLPQSANVKITPSEISNKVNNIAQPETSTPLPASQQGAPATSPTITVGEFYNSLSQEDRDKLGSMEDIINELLEVPFDIKESEFIEMLKCRL